MGKTIETDLILKAAGVKAPEQSHLLTSAASKVDHQMFKVSESPMVS